MEAGRALNQRPDSGGRDAGGNQAVSLNQIKRMLARDNKARYPMSPGLAGRPRRCWAVGNRSFNTIAASGHALPQHGAGARRWPENPRADGPAALTGQQALGTWPALGLYLAGEGGAALNRDVTRRMAGRPQTLPELGGH